MDKIKTTTIEHGDKGEVISVERTLDENGSLIEEQRSLIALAPDITSHGDVTRVWGSNTWASDATTPDHVDVDIRAPVETLDTDDAYRHAPYSFGVMAQALKGDGGLVETACRRTASVAVVRMLADDVTCEVCLSNLKESRDTQGVTMGSRGEMGAAGGSGGTFIPPGTNPLDYNGPVLTWVSDGKGGRRIGAK